MHGCEASMAYNMKHKNTPFYERLLVAESAPPANPFRADLGTVDRIKNSSQYWHPDI